jgi:hypothetical protein
MAVTAGGRGWFFFLGAVLFVVLGAVLFVVGAINAAWHGLHDMMQVGLLGAAAATGVAYVFCDWPPRQWRRN